MEHWKKMGIHLLLVVLSNHIVKNEIEISLWNSAPRLNSSSHFDYYYSCIATGQTLQWRIDSISIGGFVPLQTGDILFGTTHTFNFTATLLSTRVLQRQYIFHSILMISTTEHAFKVECRSESSRAIARNKGFPATKGVINTNTTNSVHLDYVVSQSIQNSTPCVVRIFLCGVEREFQSWETNRPKYGFGFTDPLGIDRLFLSENHTFVDQQAIFIDREPYQIVTVLLLTNESVETVICSAGLREAQLSTSLSGLSTELNVPMAMSSVSTSKLVTLASNLNKFDTSRNAESALSTGIIIGSTILVAVGISVVVCLLTIYCCICKNRKKKTREFLKEEKCGTAALYFDPAYSYKGNSSEDKGGIKNWWLHRSTPPQPVII